MLARRPIFPLQAIIASQSMVLPLEAWPTTAKLRSSGEVYSFIDE
jgi:hypothetical protein